MKLMHGIIMSVLTLAAVSRGQNISYQDLLSGKTAPLALKLKDLAI